MSRRINMFLIGHYEKSADLNLKVKYHFSYLRKHTYKTFICSLKESQNSFGRKFGKESFYLIARKGTVNYSLCKKNNIIFVLYQFLSTNNKCHVTNIYIVEENKSIILHHVLPNSPENVFSRTLLF